MGSNILDARLDNLMNNLNNPSKVSILSLGCNSLRLRLKKESNSGSSDYGPR